jgi:Ulp1 family protease
LDLLQNTVAQVLKKPSGVTNWTRGTIQGIPLQSEPLVDCGLFVVLYVQVICECLAMKRSVPEAGTRMRQVIHQRNMPMLRKKMAYALTHSKLIEL